MHFFSFDMRRWCVPQYSDAAHEMQLYMMCMCVSVCNPAYSVGRAISFFISFLSLFFDAFFNSFDVSFVLLVAVAFHHVCVCVQCASSVRKWMRINACDFLCCGCYVMLSIFIQIKFTVKRDEYMICLTLVSQTLWKTG